MPKQYRIDLYEETYRRIKGFKMLVFQETAGKVNLSLKETLEKFLDSVKEKDIALNIIEDWKNSVPRIEVSSK